MEREELRGIPANIAALIDEGYRLWRDGLQSQAENRLKEALAGAAEAGSIAGLLSARHLLGNLAYDQGDLAGAEEHHLFVLAESERLGVDVGVASSLHNLGLITARAGDLATARYQLLAAAHRYQRLGLRDAAAVVHTNLACIEAERL